MGYTDVPPAPTSKDAAKRLADAVVSHEAGLLLLEGGLHTDAKKTEAKKAEPTLAKAEVDPKKPAAPAKGIAQAEATPQKGTEGPKPGDHRPAAAAPPERQGIRQADATTDLRTQVQNIDKQFEARVQHNIDLAKAGTFAITDILKNFDRIYDDAHGLDLSAVKKDYDALRAANDPATKAVRDAENKLLHSAGIIQANKSLVAYDAAMKATPEASATQPITRADLIKQAREAMALASQDPAVKDAFGPRATEYETLVKKYALDQPVAAGQQPPAGTDKPVVAPATPEAPQEAGPSPTTSFVPGHNYTEAELKALDTLAAQHAPTRTAYEAQLFGDPAKNPDAYLNTKANIYNILTGMDAYTQQQRADFQGTLVNPSMSVADKQKYIDSFQYKAGDTDLKANATMLLKNTGDKIGVAANWYQEEGYNSQACAAYYAMAEQADVKRDNATAEKYWNQAQKYQLDSTFFTNQLQDAGVQRIDAKMMGDYQTLFAAGRDAQSKGDNKNAELLYQDSIAAADRLAAKNATVAKDNVAKAVKALTDGTALSSDDKLNIGVTAFNNVRILTAPVDARMNAAAALSGLSQNPTTGNYEATKVGSDRQAEIAGWLKQATDMSANVDTKSAKVIGDALASAAANNVKLHAPGNEKHLQTVAYESAVLVGGKTADSTAPDGTNIPGSKMPGTIDMPYTTAKMEAAFLLTQGKGTDAVTAIKTAGSREAAAKGWDLKDASLNDQQLALLMQQAKPMDPNHYMDVMTRSDNLWKTPIQALGGLAMFSVGAYIAVKLHNPAALEDAAPGMIKEGLMAGATKNLVKFSPLLYGTAGATIFSNVVDRASATHDGFIASTAKGMSLVAVVKGGRYLSRVGATGFAPRAAENMFGAAEAGGELTTSKVLGRMVTEVGGKPLAEAKMTTGELVTSMAGKGVAPRNISALASLPADTPLFTKGVLNPQVDRAFLGTGQRELAETLQQTLGKTGRFIPTVSELKGAIKGSAIDVTTGDANAINRQLALRGVLAKPLAGTARLATEGNVLGRLANEVSGTENGNLTKEQLLAYAKARNIPMKQLGSIGNVVGEDAAILKAGKFQGAFTDASPEVKAQLKEIASKTAGAKGSLTTEQLLNYARENKLATEPFENLLSKDATLVKNGRWNPDLLLKDPKTGAITRAIDTPNFKGVMGTDTMQNTELLSALSKRGVSERSVLIRLAQRANQDVPLDEARAMTKKDLVDTMTARGISAETMAKDYPKLSSLSDTDMVVKGGAFQKSLVSRDIPETMTKKDFVAWYKATKNVDLTNPTELANSPWAKYLNKAADDANIIKDGKWTVSTSRAARASVNEKNVSMSLKDLGLKEQDGNFLMTATKANLNAGQLVNLMRESNLDPKQVEALSKLAPDAPIVVDGKLVQAPTAELSATSKTFSMRGNAKDLNLKMNDGQLAVLSGEASDKEILASKWYQVPMNKWWQYPVRAPAQGAVTLGRSWKDGVVNLVDSRGGLGGLTGALDPLSATGFRKLGAQYSMQNWLYGTGGTFGTYSAYQGLRALAGPNYDPTTGESISGWQDFKDKMGGTMSTKEKLEQYAWMPQMANLFTETGGSPFWTPTKQIFFTAGIGGVKDLAESFMLGGPGATFDLRDEMLKVKQVNDAPLKDNPNWLTEPDPTANLTPVDGTPPPATQPAEAPAPVVPPPAPVKPPVRKDAPIKQSAAPPPPGPARPLIVTPGTKGHDQLDDALGGGQLK